LQKEKVRVYQLARELNVDTKILLELCKQAGFDVKNQLSNLEPEQRDSLEQLVKRGPQAAKPAAPVKPVTPVLSPDQKAVPNLGRAPRPHAPAAPVKAPEAEPAVAPPAEPLVAQAPAAAEPPSPSVTPPAAPPPVAAPVPAVPVIKDRVPTIQTPTTRDKVPTLSSTPPRPATPPAAPAVPPRPPIVQPPTARPPQVQPPPPAQPPATVRPAEPGPAKVPPRPPQTPTAPPAKAPTTLPSVSPAAKTPPALGTPARPPAGTRDGGRPGQQEPRRPRLPALGHMPRPVAPPPLKPLKPPPPKGEQVMKPIAKLTQEILDQVKNRPLRPEDLLRPPQPVGEVPDESEDEKNKNKKLKEIPGRDARTKARNERAEKRKTTRAEAVEIRGGGRIVVERDDQARGSLSKLRKKQKHQPAAHKPKGKIELETPITVRSLSEALGVRSGELLMKLLGHGAARNININSTIEPALAELVAIDYGREVELKRPADAEEEALKEIEKPDAPEDLRPRAPIVTIMGHVDHGKTSLLDKIRASNVAATEAGGITQVIRAWRVEHDGKPITFLDTPGHEAFTKMRARGAQVTDIAVIVVAADDGVMPQTEEAIQHAKAAGVSLVVAINKVDLPSANVDRAKRQLYSLNVLPDNMGGDTPFVETSAATGRGIDDLLEAISVVAELKELKANPNKPAQGTCLEAALSEGEGVRATLLVRDGTLHRGDVVLCGATYGRVRQLYNDLGQPIQEAGPSVPVRITGLDEVPNADDPFLVLPDLTVAREIAEKRSGKLHEAAQPSRSPMTLERLGEAKITELKVILKADFRGSIEAIRKELEKLTHEEVRVRVLEAGIGHITESDVWLALASPQDTMIVGFNAVPDDRARALAEDRGVQIREYNIIYDLTNDIRAALEGKLKPREEVINLGRAVVRNTFKVSRVGTIAGCYVTQGVVRRNAKVRVIREGVVVYPPADRTAGLESLKRYKDDVAEVREGFECGMKIAGYDDVKVGDVIEAYRVEQVQRTLELATAGAK
jgi:translation initiation factor IF-2